MNLDHMIEEALKEDLGGGDVTTDSLLDAPFLGRAILLAKQDLVLSGRDLFSKTITTAEPKTEIHWYFKEGETILSGQTLAHLEGDLRGILKAERVALNWIGHLSGISTLTKKFVDQISHTPCKILDTRKTTPLLRLYEKAAVVHGGGKNHRLHLNEFAMIKDNHVRAAGSVSQAIQRVRAKYNGFLEVEVTTLDELSQALKFPIQRILLDNMDTETMRSAVQQIPKTIESEASGNMTLDRVREVAECGVNYISVGAITHSAPCANLSLEFDW